MEYFQGRVDDEFRAVRLGQSKEGRDEYALELVREQGMLKDEKDKEKELRDDGYQVVVGREGKWKVDQDKN